MLNTSLGIISLLLQILVVWYGFRLWRILNPVRYWSIAWLLYSVGNFLILLRRFIGFQTAQEIIIPFNVKAGVLSAMSYEYVLQIAVSILFLLFGRYLFKLYNKYFTNGLNIESWKTELERKETQDIVDKVLNVIGGKK